MKRLLLLTALLCALAKPLAGQVPVSMAPVTKFQFFSNAGFPLSSGCVFTFQAGTSTPAITYRDSAGTIANANPIILDGGGRADIWLPNAAYKFTLKSAGGVNCVSGSTLWTVDGISGVLGLLNLNNVWTGTNQFNQPIVINVNANQIVAGTIGNRTTLNFPAPAGNITLTFPSTADTMVGRATTDTLTNKTLNSATLATPAISSPAFSGTATGTANFLPISLFNSGSGASNTTFWRGDGVWGTPPSVASAADLLTTYSNATTTFSDVTGITFFALGTTIYHVHCDLDYQTSVNTANIKFQWTGPAAPSFVTYDIVVGITSTTLSSAVGTAFSTSLAAAGTPSVATNLPVTTSMTLQTGLTSGTVQLQAAATAAGTITIIPGGCHIIKQ